LATYSQIIERDMFQKRIKEGKDIFVNEFFYPLMQGYDSVAMDVDVEIGGSDQIFNMLMGRDLMKKIKNKEKFVLATKLLVDSQGQKVGKTTGNALFLDSTPENFFGGIMSFPDEVIVLSFELLTEIPLEGIGEKIKENPMREKKRLSFETVKLLWGEQEAKKAQEEFENTFQKRQTPENIPAVSVNNNTMGVVDLLVSAKLAPSISEAKRLVKQGSVDVNGRTITDPKENLELTGNPIIKVGKTRFVKIRVNS